MKKLMVIALMLVMTGCAYSTFEQHERATIRGQDIYKGMPLTKFDSLLGPPDSTQYLSPGFMAYTYGKYTIVSNAGVITGIGLLKMSNQ